MKRVLLVCLAMLLLCGCRKPTPTSKSAPAGHPVSTVAVTYAPDAPDTPLSTRTVDYTYETDEAGRVTARHYTLGGVAYRDQTVYAADGTVAARISDRLENGAVAAGSTAHRYTYDAAGRCLTDDTFSRAGESESLTLRTTYTYGEGTRAERATLTDAAGAVRGKVQFSYTAADDTAPAGTALLETMTLTDADGTVLRTARCAYDAADRALWRETVAGDERTEETYTYDQQGNLLVHRSVSETLVCEERYTYSAE